ncbi:pyridoxal 5'-phosphate synthase glutaminase subunit PdxT [Candidatus Micrarchaeota archaeon]|nr:pyridoxal 5'-phosphate synthase glutaminase subunit PdxT [Candidatus Micrarchaeota archaeon]
MNIAVVGVQGAVLEHVHATEKAMKNLNFHGAVSWAKDRLALENADAAILPGGESTTISKLIDKNEMKDALEDLPILGTCAGMVLLAKTGGIQVQQTGQKLLQRMDFCVERNAFGRQRESFQAPVHVSFLEEPFPGIFIRAPSASNVQAPAQSVAFFNETVVGVEQQNALALAFHPELSGDLRLHEHFLLNFVKR